MNRVTKWVVRGLLGLVGLLVIAVILVYALSSRRINKVYLRGAEVPRAAMAAKWQGQFRRAASLQ